MIRQEPISAQLITGFMPKLASNSKTVANFNAFTALMLIIACAISASSRSNTGSPQPTGTFSATISSLAPQLVPCSRKDVTKASKRGTASTSPQKNGF